MKKCLECKESVVGRSDKKFCSDYCRNTFNNKVNKESRNLIRNVNNRLRKNYKVLDELLVKNTLKVSRMKLVEKNFDFIHFTSIYTTKANKTYYFIYNLGYLPLENDFYALVRREL